MVSACILAGVLIFLMPRNCDPNVEWYQGKVIMDIRPSQNGPNGTTILDLDQIKNRLIDYRNMGIATLHLKDLADRNSSMKSGDLLTSAQNALGNSGQIEDFFDRIHKENMTIIVQVQSMFFVVLFCFTLNSLISTQQILFFLRKFSYLHALLEPTRLFIFRENSYLHDY